MVNQLNGDKAATAKLVQLKVPVHMPTQDDWADYANIQGQIEVNNNYYNYVRLKMTKDTIYLVCLPNTVKGDLTKANIIMGKNVNDIPLNKKGSSSSSTKKVDSGYDHVYQVVRCDYTPLAQLIKTDHGPRLSYLSNPYIESPGKPPNASC